MNLVNVTVEYKDVLLTVEAEYVPGQSGGWDDESWDAHFDDAVVLIGDVVINSLLSDDEFDAIVGAAEDKFLADRDSDRAEYEIAKSERSSDYGF